MLNVTLVCISVYTIYIVCAFIWINIDFFSSSLEWTSTQWESGEDEETEEESEAPAFEHVRVVQSGPAGRGRGIPAPRGQPTPGTRQPVQVQSRGKAQDDDDVWDSDVR